MTPVGGPAAHDVLLAHHVALLAIPAIVPAVIVVGVVLYIARKDRIEEREEQALIDRAFEPDTPGNGTREPTEREGRENP